MRVDVLTLFPGMFSGPFSESMLQRAVKAGALRLGVHNIRDYAAGRHQVTDDYPFGGGPGMVLKPEPIFGAVEAITADAGADARVILMSPQGRTFTQSIAAELAREEWLVLICGHYEGVDERVRSNLACEELSIGDYVLTGGELPAMVVIDAVTRLRPGVLAEGSAGEESFATGFLEYPQYTRPRVFRGWEVPEVLLSGDHERVRVWRRREALRRTLEHRPDLIGRVPLTAEDLAILCELAGERELP